MSKLHPVINTGTANMHVAGAVIRPGETRMVELHLVPPNLQPKPAAQAKTQDATDYVARQAAAKVSDIIPMIPSRTDEQLDELEEFEKAGKARSTVLEALAAERLKRAAGKSPEGGSDGAGEEGAE